MKLFYERPTPRADQSPRLVVARLRELGFDPRLSAEGALLVDDKISTSRNVLKFVPLVFERLNAGLDQNAALLDSEEETKDGVTHADLMSANDH